MEGTRTFDLEKEINDYSIELSEGRLDHSDRLELVDHFKEETRDLIENGLNAEEAFVVSRLRFGDRNLVSDEFRKVNPGYNLNQVMLKSVFLGISCVMILSISPYISYLSAGGMFDIFAPTSGIFIGTDLFVKIFFTGAGLYAINLLVKIDHRNSEIYIMILIIYLLMFVVMYFISGQLPTIDPSYAKKLWQNSVWVNVGSLLILIIYNLYLACNEYDSNIAETI
ncbi:MAG: hypothetical protein IPL46_22485 [Saprospiraceae bacterium]|nr:hypothetical protein [Saprospiraceae bacterium]